MDLNYKIFLLEDNGNYAELDCEDIQMQTTFAISDISDITSKKDTISINITLKGTKNNNRVFGNVYNQSRYVEAPAAHGNEMLFTNYSINSKVNCMVLENSIQILTGYLQISKVYQTDGVLNYECIIIGNIVNFFQGINNRMTDDLDFSYMQHTYSVNNIVFSWGDPLNAAIYYYGEQVPFELGKGYVYPFINYGQNSPSDVAKIAQMDYSNFRPAVYVNEYMNAIFGGTALAGSGYTYEVRGTDEFINNWNSLIIPPDGDYYYVRNAGDFTMFAGADTSGANVSIPGFTSITAEKFILPLVYQGTSTIENDCLEIDHITGAKFNSGQETSVTVDYLKMHKNVVGDLTITVPNITVVSGRSGRGMNVYLRLYSRTQLGTGDGNYSNLDSFGVDEDIAIGTADNSTLSVSNKVLFISQKLFDASKEYMAGIVVESVDNQNLILPFSISWSSATITISGATKYSVVLGDNVAPNPVIGIKQQDFVKSLINLFNLYTYSELETPKHIIFETFESFYANNAGRLIGTNSIDYTKKIDYSQNFTFEPATQLSDSYTFTYKSDSDFYNTTYTNSWNEVYGTYGFTNSYNGNSDTKVELTFSPTPVVSFAGTNRIEPEIYSQDDNGTRTPFKSNCRILYYNGIRKCTPWQIGAYDASGNWTSYPPIPLASSFKFYAYPMCSTYKYLDGSWSGTGGVLGGTYSMAPTASIPTNDLNFSHPKQLYFTVGSEIWGAVNAFDDFYANQLGQMSNVNNYFIECSAWLNENDISNLDLSVPIFIQNQFGSSYYNILQVDYTNRFEASTLKLQKINF